MQPIANEALFDVNLKTRTKMSECVPVLVKAITALLDGRMPSLGMVDGTLFIFDKNRKTVLSTHELFKARKPNQNMPPGMLA